MTQTKKSFRSDPFYIIFKWALILLIAILAVTLFSRPLCHSWSGRFLEKGDQLLAQKRYLQAEMEYKKSILIDKRNDEARQRLTLAEEGSTDILKLKDFFIEKNLTIETDLFTKATAIPAKERDAVVTAKELIEEEEYQLAIIPAATAVEMDNDYRDGWLYLGIANIKCAQFLEISGSSRQYYLGKAKIALDRTKAIDPEYKPTLDYINLLAQLSA